MDILSILGSIITGGATGLVGTAISHYVDIQKTKLANAQELALAQESRELMKLEIAGREQVAQIEGETAINVEELHTLAQSYGMDKATYSSGDSRWLILVDVVRGLTRPVLTLGLVGFVIGLWATSDDPVLESRIVASVLYITTAAVLWWFGSRPPKKNPT